MKKELVLIRHTKSSWKDLSMADFDRPLKKDRIDDAKNMGRYLRELGLKPDLVLCSPALRTRQTAELICDKLKYDFDEVSFDKRIYESTAEEVMQVVREVAAEVNTLVVIGHNPSLSHFAAQYTDKLMFEMPTTGVAWLEFENSDWEIYKTTKASLKYLLDPETIK